MASKAQEYNPQAALNCLVELGSELDKAVEAAKAKDDIAKKAWEDTEVIRAKIEQAKLRLFGDLAQLSARGQKVEVGVRHG